MATAKTIPAVISDGTESPGAVQTKDYLHFARRGADIDESLSSGDISGIDAERMRARAFLTADEEKKLMRRVDLRIMTLCSLLFLFKNIDSDNISNARIMNRGTDRNIMTQLGLTSDEYNLLTVFYYVSLLCHPSDQLKRLRSVIGPIHNRGGPIQSPSEESKPQHLAVKNHDIMGDSSLMPCTRDEQGWYLGHQIPSWTGKSTFFDVREAQPLLSC